MRIPELNKDHPGVPVTAAGVEGLDQIAETISRLRAMLTAPAPVSPFKQFAQNRAIDRTVREINNRVDALRAHGDTVDPATLEVNDTYRQLLGCYNRCRDTHNLAYDDACELRAAFDRACSSYIQRVAAAPNLDDEHRVWIRNTVIPRLEQAAHEDALARNNAQRARLNAIRELDAVR